MLPVYCLEHVLHINKYATFLEEYFRCGGQICIYIYIYIYIYLLDNTPNQPFKDKMPIIPVKSNI